MHTYETPELVVYGNIEDVTKMNGQGNFDVPHGDQVSAFPSGTTF